jgi:hypothetical protein
VSNRWSISRTFCERNYGGAQFRRDIAPYLNLEGRTTGTGLSGLLTSWRAAMLQNQMVFL